VRVIDVIRRWRRTWRCPYTRTPKRGLPRTKGRRFRGESCAASSSLLEEIVSGRCWYRIPRQIAQLPLRIDDARSFEPVPAVTTKLHFWLPSRPSPLQLASRCAADAAEAAHSWRFGAPAAQLRAQLVAGAGLERKPKMKLCRYGKNGSKPPMRARASSMRKGSCAICRFGSCPNNRPGNNLLRTGLTKLAVRKIRTESLPLVRGQGPRAFGVPYRASPSSSPSA